MHPTSSSDLVKPTNALQKTYTDRKHPNSCGEHVSQPSLICAMTLVLFEFYDTDALCQNRENRVASELTTYACLKGANFMNGWHFHL